MYLDYPAFERSMTATFAVFAAWDDSLKEFTNVAREVTRKRLEKFLAIKIVPAQGKLVDRVKYLRDFRRKHQQLLVMMGPLGNEVRGKRLIGDGTTATTERGSAFGSEIDMEAEVSGHRFLRVRVDC